jgi:hypothetical protein
MNIIVIGLLLRTLIVLLLFGVLLATAVPIGRGHKRQRREQERNASRITAASPTVARDDVRFAHAARMREFA